MAVIDQDISEVLELARTRVDIINKLANWGKYIEQHGLGPKEGDELMNILSKNNGRLAAIAWRRAEASGRDFDSVFEETNLEFLCNVGKVMEKEMVADPREMAMKGTVALEEKSEQVCGVCQDELEVGELVTRTTCMHKFHGLCLWKWLSARKTCPLCRFTILP